VPNTRRLASQINMESGRDTDSRTDSGRIGDRSELTRVIEFNGQVAVVTGAGRGLGRHLRLTSPDVALPSSLMISALPWKGQAQLIP
jgi:hypothetical protein